AHAARDILAFAVSAEGGEGAVLDVSECLAGARVDIENEALGPAAAAALAGNHDHVVGGPQVALLDALLVNQLVVDFELIERVANPAEVLRTAPGGEHGEARQVDRVLLDIGRGGQRDRL